MRSLLAFSVVSSLGACATTDNVTVELAPNLISSIDGQAAFRVQAFAGGELIGGDPIDVAVEYVDRNGTSHAITALAGTIADDGSLEGEFSGLTWDGSGTVTAVVHGGSGDVTGSATFAVLDRTPPKLSIIGPASHSVRINDETTVMVHVEDEIGISQVFFEASFSNNPTGGNTRARGTVIASGSLASDVPFDLRAQDTQIGDTITLYALAADLSGNQAAAAPVTLTVVP